jgi:hypothetical protein
VRLETVPGQTFDPDDGTSEPGWLTESVSGSWRRPASVPHGVTADAASTRPMSGACGQSSCASKPVMRMSFYLDAGDDGREVLGEDGGRTDNCSGAMVVPSVSWKNGSSTEKSPAPGSRSGRSFTCCPS